MFADKSSWFARADPLSRLLFLSFTFSPNSPLLTPSPTLSLSLPALPVSSLNNKYERVLREYPEGAISGVQASDHPLAPFETVLRLAPNLPLASSTTRNASLIHLEERREAARVYRGGVEGRGWSPIALWRGCLFSFRSPRLA